VSPPETKRGKTSFRDSRRPDNPDPLGAMRPPGGTSQKAIDFRDEGLRVRVRLRPHENLTGDSWTHSQRILFSGPWTLFCAPTAEQSGDMDVVEQVILRVAASTALRQEQLEASAKRG